MGRSSCARLLQTNIKQELDTQLDGNLYGTLIGDEREGERGLPDASEIGHDAALTELLPQEGFKALGGVGPIADEDELLQTEVETAVVANAFALNQVQRQHRSC